MRASRRVSNPSSAPPRSLERKEEERGKTAFNQKNAHAERVLLGEEGSEQIPAARHLKVRLSYFLIFLFTADAY